MKRKIMKLFKLFVTSSFLFSSFAYSDIFVCNQSTVPVVDVSLALPDFNSSQVSGGKALVSKGWFSARNNRGCVKIYRTQSDISTFGFFAFGNYPVSGGGSRIAKWTSKSGNFSSSRSLCVDFRNTFSTHHTFDPSQDNLRCSSSGERVNFGIISPRGNKDVYVYLRSDTEGKTYLRWR